MTHQVDLGQCLYFATDVNLQLHFAATAHLTLPYPSRHLEGSNRLYQWPDPLTVWVAAAPELEMHLVIRVELGLKDLGSKFVTNLGERLCVSKVWANLGMDIRLKRCINLGHTDGAATYRLTFGLCRGLAASRATKGRSLPIVITSGQDAQPPYGIHTMSLAAIEIYLEYHTIEQQLKDQAKLHSNGTEAQNAAHCQSPASFQHLADANVASIVDLCLFNHNPSSYSTGVAQVNPQSSTPFYQLLELCLQRLILGVTVKIPQIQVADSNTLQNLSHLAPVIFNAGYNEAMSQRAVSINPLAKSIASMLENTANPILQKQVSRFLQQSQIAVEADSHEIQCGISQKFIIQSALWRITQAKLPKPKPAKNAAQFFDVGLNAERPKSNRLSNGLRQDESSDHELLELEWDRNFDHDRRHDAFDVSQPAESSNSEEEIDGLLIDTNSESSFRDISESTQTTLDWEDTSSPDSDNEMLLELEPEEGITEGEMCF